mgnify:CR=1 FL=1
MRIMFLKSDLTKMILSPNSASFLLVEYSASSSLSKDILSQKVIYVKGIFYIVKKINIC